MDRIEDSGSLGWGSIPHGSTYSNNTALRFSAVLLYVEPNIEPLFVPLHKITNHEVYDFASRLTKL